MSGNKTLEKAVMDFDIDSSVSIIKQFVKKDGWKSVLSEILEYLDRKTGESSVSGVKMSNELKNAIWWIVENRDK